MKLPRNQRLSRAQAEAYEAASVVFAEAGWAYQLEFGSKHALIVATSPANAVARLPLCGSPRGGVDRGRNIARWNARKIVRQGAA